MQLAKIVLLPIAFSCTAELKVDSIEYDAQGWPETNKPTVEGCYAKPVGKCEIGDEDCSCNKPCFAIVAQDSQISPHTAIACSKDCEETTDCPTDSNYKADCVFGYCGLTCTTNSDCPEGEVCVYQLPGWMCMFPHDEPVLQARNESQALGLKL